MPSGKDACWPPCTESHHTGIIGGEDRPAIRRQGGDELPLCQFNRIKSPSPFGVYGINRRNHADAWARHRTEGADLASNVHPHLRHKALRVVWEIQERKRESNLIVCIPRRRCHSRRLAAECAVNRLLGRRLPYRSSDANRLQVKTGTPCRRKATQRCHTARSTKDRNSALSGQREGELEMLLDGAVATLFEEECARPLFDRIEKVEATIRR